MSVPVPEKRIAEFENFGFGMFIHWGIYSQLGQGEWVMNIAGIPKEEYKKLGFDDYLSKPIIAIKLEQMIQKYLPKELLMKNDLEQKEEISATPGDTVRSASSEKGLVYWEMGKALCMEDEEIYREVLQAFLESPSAMELRQYYEESDFDNYRIKIHAMKTNLANIGAMSVSDRAKQLELALSNENNVSYVQENHDEFMKEYKRVVSEVKTYMESR